MFSVENTDICSCWDWLSFVTCNPNPSVYAPGGGWKREKKSFPLCMQLTDLYLLFFKFKLILTWWSASKTLKCNAYGRHWCDILARRGVAEAQAIQTVAFSCSEICTEPPTARNITGMKWVGLFPTLQHSVRYPHPGDKVHFFCFSGRVPLQQTWGYTNWLAKKLISKTRNRLVWITKRNNMKPLISMVSMNGKAE